MSEQSQQHDDVWARVQLLLRPGSRAEIRGWEIIDAVPPLRFGDLVETEDWERTAAVEVGELRAADAGGTQWQPWLVRAFLEATVDGAWLAMADTDPDVLADRHPVLDALDALDSLDAVRLIHRAQWRRMLDHSLPPAPPAVETWHHWVAIADWGQLSTAEMFHLFPVRAPISRSGDALPVALVAQIRAAYLIFQELYTRLRAEGLPAVVRRTADAYGGLTVLEMIRTGRTSELAEDLRASFDYGAGT